MPHGVTAPESIAFGIFGIGPYITVADGRILRWAGHSRGFVDFAYTSPKRTKEECDGATHLELGPKCGRPLAISFNYFTGTLYIVDAYFGLLEVGFFGGLARSIATSADDKVPFKFLAGVDVDTWTGVVYFSDASSVFSLRDYELGKTTKDITGKFLKYNPWTGKVTVLLLDLNGGGTPAVSRDGSYVLIPEYRAGNVHKYWICGPKANTVERNLLSVAGYVNKIKKAEIAGEYWVAVELIQNTQADDGSTIVKTVPRGLRIDGDGNVLQTLHFEAQFYNETVGVIQQQKGALYVGGRETDFISKYTD